METCVLNHPMEWYRPSPLRAITLVAFLCGSLMSTGVIIMAFGLDMSGRVPQDIQPYCVAVGMGMVIIGVICAVFFFVRIAGHQGCHLVLGVKGLQYWDQETSWTIPWQKLVRVDGFPKHLIIFEEEGRTETIEEQFIGISNPALAIRIIEIQRKVLLGILP